MRYQRKRKRRYGRPGRRGQTSEGRRGQTRADRRGQIKGRISLDLRPRIVDERSRLGDWEADLVEGSKGGAVLMTLAERKSRLTLGGKAKNKSATEVTELILGLLTPIKEYLHTITYDNGK